MIQTSNLLEQARAQTGLTDFGEDSFREPLEKLVDALNRESQFTPFGEKALPGMIVGLLVNRLEIEEWYARHPEIEEQQILAPTFGIGLGRTGSTALGFMLALDRNTRVLREWENKRPCPPPESATEDNDPRIAEAEESSRLLETVVPELRDMLPRDARGPAECARTLALSFAHPSFFEVFAHVPSYAEWVASSGFDQRPAYRYHRRVIKLLQWRCPPNRWFLRTPIHLSSLDALNEVYPDAQFVMTHRDPVKVLPSTVSLMHNFRKSYVRNNEPEFGKVQELYWEYALKRALAFRDHIGEERFFDVSHRRQSQDPVEQIRTLYAKFGWSFDKDLETRISQWQDTNPKGDHKFSPSDFGLDINEIAQRYKFYSDRFATMM
jgi:hypothetical protein